MTIPVALFTYKRPFHTKATLDALAKNKLADQTSLYIFCDEAKSSFDKEDVIKVRRIAHEVSGFASVRVFERNQNLGLANSIITGVTEVLSYHDRIIVLEDDLVTTPNFLTYMNYALENYKNDPRVFSVTGFVFANEYMKIPADYPYDTFVGYRCASWSWGTWADRWSRISWEMDYFESFKNNPIEQQMFNRSGQDMTTLLTLQYHKKIDSWAIRFCYAHHKYKMWCIYPIKSLVKNIGLDYSGTHSRPEPRYTHKYLDNSWLPRVFCPTESDDQRITANFRAIFDPPPIPRLSKIKDFLWIKTTNSFRKVYRLINKISRYLWPSKETVDILVVNSFQKNGGAARAAYRTFLGLKKYYPSSRYLTLFKEASSIDVIGRYQWSPTGILAKIMIGLDRIPLYSYVHRNRTTFSTSFWANPLRIPLSKFKPSIVNIHWIGVGILRVEELSKLHCPIVWTLHDMWAFTGGCHYSGNCERFKIECGCCPQLNSQRERDISYSLVQRKLKVFEKINLTIVTPSRWLADQARSSKLMRNLRIEVIPNGLDTEIFKPLDKGATRAYLNIPMDIPVLLFGAQSLLDPRKGGDLLCELLTKIDFKCVLLTFGEGHLPIENLPNIKIQSLGSLTDDMSLALVYSAADIFLCLSREDNLPNTVAEALSCGTPCAAFDINGLPDMIENKVNGWLAPPFETNNLAEGLRWLAFHPEKEKLQQAARNKAIIEYSLERMTERYINLFSELQGKFKN